MRHGRGAPCLNKRGGGSRAYTATHNGAETLRSCRCFAILAAGVVSMKAEVLNVIPERRLRVATS